MLDVLIGYPPGRRSVCVRPGPGPVAGSSTVGRVHRPPAKGRQRRGLVRSGLAWCRQSPNTISLLLSAARRTVFSFAGYLRVCCAGYITPVTERSPGGLTPAKHATIGRVATLPSRRSRARSTGLSGRVTPATTSRPVMDHRGPSSLHCGQRRSRSRPRLAPHGSMKWSAGWLTHCTRLDAAEVAAVGYLDAT
jgi:hypothetical protein